MSISAVYRKGVIKPLVEVDLKENEEIEIKIKRKKSVVDEITGAIKIDPGLAKKIAESDELTYSMWAD
jgi:predicted DNA-binding antitoxin AbrB/MazE fold protein